jgi:hypothetical protein
MVVMVHGCQSAPPSLWSAKVILGHFMLVTEFLGFIHYFTLFTAETPNLNLNLNLTSRKRGNFNFTSKVSLVKQ